jgi:hypothetical protein
MANKDTDPRLKNFSKKYAKVLEADPDFLDKVQQSSKDDLNKIIIETSELIVEFTKDMENDQDLLDKKEAVKEAAATYVDGIKVNKARNAYAIYIKKSM